MRTVFTPVERLDEDARSAMRELLARHFFGVDHEGFAADLAGKSHALRLFVDDGRLAGFSTIDYRRIAIAGTPAAVLYSGDTIVDPSAWAAASLGAAWVAAVLGLHRERSAGLPLWWLLLTSGVRTHRYLSVFCRRYHPAPPGREDPEAARLLPLLAAARFGAGFCVQSGVVRLATPQRLRTHLDALPAHLADDPHTRLFLAANPGHAAGDELASLCRLDEENLNAAGLRALARGRQAVAAG
jgi:hypothetical protein